nr:capsid protein [Chlorocebus cynosuros associated smacovirus]
MFVKVSETYDLSTKVNKMGFLGIHTPDGPLVHDHYSGLFQNFKKFRYVSCDVAMACASMLPADPLQIGVEAGDIAPQDMFNPILYKACSNDSMSTLLNRLYAGQAGASSNVIAKNSVVADNSPDFGYDDDNFVDQFAMYYGLLSDTSGWKKAMPQQGLTMTGLRPLTFGILATQGQPSIVGD